MGCGVMCVSLSISICAYRVEGGVESLLGEEVDHAAVPRAVLLRVEPPAPLTQHHGAASLVLQHTEGRGKGGSQRVCYGYLDRYIVNVYRTMVLVWVVPWRWRSAWSTRPTCSRGSHHGRSSPDTQQ
jgi:hypothetical protein